MANTRPVSDVTVYPKTGCNNAFEVANSFRRIGHLGKNMGISRGLPFFEMATSRKHGENGHSLAYVLRQPRRRPGMAAVQVAMSQRTANVQFHRDDLVRALGGGLGDDLAHERDG